VDVGKCTVARPLLLDAGGTGRFAQHPALRNENNMTVRELLLQFPCESTEIANRSISQSTDSHKIQSHLCCTFRNAFNWGTGTKTTIAFFPPRTSTSRAADICRGRSSVLSSGTLFSKSTSAWATLVSISSGGVVGALAVRRILCDMIGGG